MAEAFLTTNESEKVTTPPSDSVRRVRVRHRRDIAPDIIELELESLDGSALPPWEPGAHIDIRLGDDLIRQYSLVPSRDPAGTWQVAILVEEGGRGGSLMIARDLHPGEAVDVSGPRNHFPFDDGVAECLFIGGGIGITPLIAMARSAQGRGIPWRLAYLGRSRSTMAYVAELEREFGAHVEVYAADEGRRFDVEDSVRNLSPSTHVYCCGPNRLMEAVEQAMSEPDLVPRVHLEHFHPRTIAEGMNHEFTVYAAASGVEFVVPVDESVLMAADFEGVVVPGDCLEGTCGSCETRVLVGEIDHRDSILTPLQRLDSQTMMICVSRARPGCSRIELDL